MQKRTADLGVAPLGSLLLKLSLPAIAGMLVMALYNIIDTYWAGRLGTSAVAALTVVFPWQMIVGALGSSVGVGVSSFVSRRFGEGHGELANRAAGQVILFTFIAGPVLGLVAVVFSLPVVRLFGATPELVGLASNYLHGLALGVPFIIFLMATSGLYRGAGNTVFPTVTLITSALLNALFAPLLILGLFGLPRLGVTGLGLATAASQVLGSLLATIYLRTRHSGFHVQWRHLRPDAGVIKDISLVGGPTFGMQAVAAAILSLYNGVLGRFGTVAIAAYGIDFRLFMVVMMPFFGTSQGLMPIVGFNFGARRYDRMWRVFYLAAGATALNGLVLGGALWLGAPAVARLFTSDLQLQNLAVLAIRITVVTLWLVGPQIMLASAMNGMGHGPHAMVLAVSRQLLFLLPGLYLFSARYGVVGTFAAQPVADVLSCAVSAAFLAHMLRRYKPARAAREGVEWGRGEAS